MQLVGVGDETADSIASLAKASLLIWPIVSIGNVGQLCVDALLATDHVFGFRKIGVIVNKKVLPLVGYRGEHGDELTAAMELYYSSDWGVTLLQQRTPIIQGQEEEFCNEVGSWIASLGFLGVLLLGSSPAYRRADDQLRSESPLALFAYEASPLYSPLAIAVQKVNIGRTDDSLWEHLSRYCLQQEQTRSEEFSLPTVGTGCSKSLFLACHNRGIPVVVVFAFINEGDNSLDGIVQAQLVLQILCEMENRNLKQDQPIQWRTPPEWRFAFGGQHDPYLYLQ